MNSACGRREIDPQTCSGTVFQIRGAAKQYVVNPSDFFHTKVEKTTSLFLKGGASSLFYFRICIAIIQHFGIKFPLWGLGGLR